jgi:drug/metabolite transporter (DMT)-like permease
MKGPILFLALSLIVTGCLNSIFTKYQDNQYVTPTRKFEQPVLQTLQMFIGESCAFLFYFANRRSRAAAASSLLSHDALKPALPRSKVIMLAIPSICDILGTTMMNLGLVYSPVSIYQMMRGALILFVAAFSILFLGKTITRIEWSSLFVVILGITIVGLSSNKNAGSEEVAAETSSKVAIGIALILLSQIFTATQFVVEEHIVGKWHIEPLQLVGYEGVFGGSITLVSMIMLYFPLGYQNQGPFDIVNSWREFSSNTAIIYTSLAIMVSIGLFNFFGITLTSKLSATARSTIDTCRTLLVWLVSLYLGWESFVALQLFGFGFLVFGTLVFNGAIVVDQYLPEWFSADKQRGAIRIVDTIDEQIERQ